MLSGNNPLGHNYGYLNPCPLLTPFTYLISNISRCIREFIEGVPITSENKVYSLKHFLASNDSNQIILELTSKKNSY